jgi:hypothetical protein
VEGHGEAAAKWRNAAIGFVVARLAQAQCGAVREREKDAQAFALVDDVRDGAGQAVARRVAGAVVDQQFFAMYRQDQRVAVRDGPGAAQDAGPSATLPESIRRTGSRLASPMKLATKESAG